MIKEPNFSDAVALKLMSKITAFRSSLNAAQQKVFDELIESIMSMSPEGLDDDDDEVFDEDELFLDSMPDFRLTVKVQLKNVEPAVWRKLVVPASLTLAGFSHVVNIAMGWSGGHLHGFRKGQTEIVDELSVSLWGFLNKKGDWFTYEYDFGDSWEHRVELVANVDLTENRDITILTGKNACPPDDFGGPWYYTEFLDAFLKKDKKALKGEFAEVMEWLPEGFDPSEFDIVPIQEELDDFSSGKWEPLLS